MAAAVPGLYPAQSADVALPGKHLQPAVSPGGPVSLKVENGTCSAFKIVSKHINLANSTITV